jgi:hypothetical protein
MAMVFKGLASQRGIQRLSPGLVIEKAKDYAPEPTDQDFIRRNDAPWIKRFAAAGGEVIISGDKRMRSVPAEREALVQSKQIVFFFDPAWNNFDFCDKCAMLLHWWPALLVTASKAAKPSFWRIPAGWRSDAGIVEVAHTDLKLERIERQKAAGPKIRARRRAAAINDPAQRDIAGLEKKADGKNVKAS